MAKNAVRTRGIAIAAVAVAAALLWASATIISHRRAKEGSGQDRFFTVKRGDFTVTLTLDGSLDAIKRHDLKSEAADRWRSKIVELVTDRAVVKAGDVVARLSDSEAADATEGLRQDLDDQQTALRLAMEDLQMTRASNLNAIKFAADAVRDSIRELNKYEQQDAPKKKRELNTAIITAEAKLAEAAKKVVEGKAAMSEAQLQDPEKVAAIAEETAQAEKAEAQARAERETAVDNVRTFKRYDHPIKMRQLEDAVTRNRLSFQKAIIEANSNIVKANSSIRNLQRSVKMLDTKVKEADENLKKMVLKAPVDGVVSLGNPNENMWSEPKEIKVGTEVGRNEIIASIPDLSKFMVIAEVPEEFRSRIVLEQPAFLRSKAIPDLRLTGKIMSIAPMGTPQIRWDPSSPKVYVTKFSTDQSDPRLMPGMTMTIEITVEEVKDVLFVPVEALYDREGKTCCRTRSVKGFAEKTVVAGRSSSDYVEIKSGLEEGDAVLLHGAE